LAFLSLRLRKSVRTMMAISLRAQPLVAPPSATVRRSNNSNTHTQRVTTTTRASSSDEELQLVRLTHRLEATEAELEARDAQLQASYVDQNELIGRLEAAHAELAEEHLGRVAAEKALDSLQKILEETLVDIRAIEEARDTAELALKQDEVSRHQQVAQLEEDIRYAAKEAKLYLHREMEALAEVELQKETIDMLKGENTKLRSQLVELQTKMTFDNKDDKDDKDERAAGKADPSKKKKKSASKKNGSTVRITNAEVVADLSELERALEDEAKATKRRSYEIRAEAALLVETVEDRAIELVEKAQREVAVLKAELEKVKGGE